MKSLRKRNINSSKWLCFSTFFNYAWPCQKLLAFAICNYTHTQYCLSQRHMLGEDLGPLNIKELQQLEEQLEYSLSQARQRKVHHVHQCSNLLIDSVLCICFSVAQHCSNIVQQRGIINLILMAHIVTMHA